MKIPDIVLLGLTLNVIQLWGSGSLASGSVDQVDLVEIIKWLLI